jgi:hypothetical protein
MMHVDFAVPVRQNLPTGDEGRAEGLSKRRRMSIVKKH